MAHALGVRRFTPSWSRLRGVALLEATEGKALEKLKQHLSCVVDEIVVEGRSHITPYFFACRWSERLDWRAGVGPGWLRL